MLTESVMLAAMGGLCGLVLGVAFHSGLLHLVSDRIPVPRLDQVKLDLPVVMLTLAVALGSGVLFGIVPAMVASRDLNGSLREDRRHSAGVRPKRILGAHVVTEIAVALVLLVSAGLLIRSLLRLQEVDPGFRPSGLLTARVTLPGTRYSEEPRKTAFFNTVLAKISTAPGVESAAGTASLPMTGPPTGTSVYRADGPAPAPGERQSSDVRQVTPGFFRTMRIPLLSGREFAASDTSQSKQVAIISEALVRRFFPGENPIGRRLIVRLDPPYVPWEIVGVVRDIKGSSLDQGMRPCVWIPQTQLSTGQMTFIVRTERDPLSLAGALRQSIGSLDAELPVTNVRTMDDVVAQTEVRPKTVAKLLGIFATMALVLAGVGVYGVMTYSVTQRTHEIGIRIALGASRSGLMRAILGEALTLAVIGLGIGLGGVMALTRIAQTRLTGVEANDPLAIAAVATLLGVTALIASLIPAVRAASVDPAIALRVE
jgi:putative ABC transport system permease protein